MLEFKRDRWLPVAPLLPNDWLFPAWIQEDLLTCLALTPFPQPPDLTTSPLHHHDPLVKPNTTTTNASTTIRPLRGHLKKWATRSQARCRLENKRGSVGINGAFSQRAHPVIWIAVVTKVTNAADPCRGVWRTENGTNVLNEPLGGL